MEYTLVIEGTLPGLNQYQYACRSHYTKGNEMKSAGIATVSAYIMQQLRGVHISNRVRLDFKWYEPNMKRDLDNIAGFGKKVIQDALIYCDILENDGWKQIAGFSDEFYLDRENPRIEVIIREVEEPLVAPKRKRKKVKNNE